MVGKELMELNYDAEEPEKAILSTYVPMTKPMAEQSDDDVSTSTGVASNQGESSGADAEEKEGIADLKATRPDMDGMFGDDDGAAARSPADAAAKGESTEDVEKAAASLDKVALVEKDAEEKKAGDDEDGTAKTDGSTAEAPAIESKASEDTQDSKPKMRFKEKLSDAQIEEAKATGRAQLGLAFEMLTMMKKRALKADPDAYQCLIDACGRVGDTKRATELLAKMHEDGIVADGTVYACLVSAFSAEGAWKKGNKVDEDLPGMFVFLKAVVLFDFDFFLIRGFFILCLLFKSGPTELQLKWTGTSCRRDHYWTVSRDSLTTTTMTTTRLKKQAM